MALESVVVTVTMPPPTPVVVEIVAAKPGEDGAGAYQSYLDTTTDDPPLTEAEWSASRAVAALPLAGGAMDEGAAITFANGTRIIQGQMAAAPTATDDETKGFVAGSVVMTDAGYFYDCASAAEGAAVWNLRIVDLSGYLPLSGGNLVGNLDLGNNAITNAWYVAADAFVNRANSGAPEFPFGLKAPAGFDCAIPAGGGTLMTDATGLPLSGGTMAGSINMNYQDISWANRVSASYLFGLLEDSSGATQINQSRQLLNSIGSTMLDWGTNPYVVMSGGADMGGQDIGQVRDIYGVSSSGVGFASGIRSDWFEGRSGGDVRFGYGIDSGANYAQGGFTTGNGAAFFPKGISMSNDSWSNIEAVSHIGVYNLEVANTMAVVSGIIGGTAGSPAAACFPYGVYGGAGSLDCYYGYTSGNGPAIFMVGMAIQPGSGIGSWGGSFPGSGFIFQDGYVQLNTYMDMNGYSLNGVGSIYAYGGSACYLPTAGGNLLTDATGVLASDCSYDILTNPYAVMRADNGYIQMGTLYANDLSCLHFSSADSIKLNPLAVTALFASPTEGTTACVNDADTPVIGSAVVGGGAAKCLVCHNGTSWIVTALL